MPEPIWLKEHPIFGTDFTQPPTELIEKLRSQLANIRGQMFDISRVYTGFQQQLDDAQGALTLCISYLYYIKEEMEKCGLDKVPSDKGA